MPFTTTGAICSVDSTDAAVPRCSTSNAAPRCSAHCDSAQRCSAFFAPAGVNVPLICSTLGGTARTCSVLQPPIQQAGPSQCSAFGGSPGSDTQCSVMAAGADQACSAQNPARLQQNACSTFSSTGAVGVIQCSVLRGGANARNLCSVGNAAQPSLAKRCSTFSPGSDCSVLPGSRGICTAFAPAPAASCSTFAAPSTCSLIGGPGGALCRWP
ncbi:MAG: hypothetical protein EYC70_17220 [Planctomycetota bacterium]|nr:MAG: hypothetical protein EYC70_17220 [Planctomycetota bacterium]